MKKLLPLFIVVFAFNLTAQTRNPLSSNAATKEESAAETIVVESFSNLSPGLTLTDTTSADFQAGTATNVDLSTNPGSIILAKPTIIDQQSTTVSLTGTGITPTTWGGQTFTPAVSGLLTKMEMNFFCSGCTGTTPDIIVSLRATSGGLPIGADLATATIPGFSSGTSTYYTGVFNAPPMLTAGTQYAFVVRPSANPSPGVYAITRTNNDAYAGGARVTSSNSGASWSIPLSNGASTDTAFRVFMNAGYATSGNFVSALKDAKPGSMQTVTWDSLSWTGTTPANTSLAFQLAASNDPAGPFNFVGPDGTAASFYTVSGVNLNGLFNNNRYLKYKAYLASTDAAQTPVLNDVTIAYSTVGPTAANAAISGRVMTANGRGVSGARVTLTTTDGEMRAALSNSSGFYRFDEVPAGETYTISATHKIHRFAPQAISLLDNAAEMNFIALP